MAKKRDAIFTEAQIQLIKAIAGQQIVLVGDKSRYKEVNIFDNPRDIPDVEYVQSQLGTGLNYQTFSETDLVSDGIGGYSLPFVLPEGEAAFAMRIDYSDDTSLFIFPQYSSTDEAILGFTNNNEQSIKVWSTGGNFVPPTPPPAPVFTLQPSTPVSVLQGTILTLTVSASNTTSYQWYKDDVALSGETSATLNVTNFNSGKAGAYKAMAIGSGGTTFSNTSIVTNDVGVLIYNLTSGDLGGNSYTPVSLTATDGTSVLNISNGNFVRLRSGVNITISGYGSTPLSYQDSTSAVVNMASGSDTINAPLNSPINIYHAIEEYTLYVSESAGIVSSNLSNYLGPITLGTSISFNFNLTLNEISSGTSFTSAGTGNLTSGNSSQSFYTFSPSVYEFVSATLSVVSPNPADGHQINV